MRLLAVVLILTSWQCFSQEPVYIDARYENNAWEEVVQDLESRYPLKFYYPADWIEGFNVTQSSEKQLLNDFLRDIFSGTNLYFHIQNSRVIITKDYRIMDHWPLDSQPLPDEPEQAFQTPASEPPETNSNETRMEFTIGDPQQRFYPGQATIYGYVKDIESGEPLVGVSVYLQEPLTGTTTDAFGYYILAIPKGQVRLRYTSVGMKDIVADITLHGDGRLDIEMTEKVMSLSEVVISDEKDNVESIQTGLARLDIKELKNIPTALGEIDVMKIALTIPGVQTVGEGASGFNVRGGNTDQNLVLLNNMVIYNPSHLFGFFSVFNPDVIRNANLYKSGIQAQYGGRVSSVFDIGIRDGNRKKLTLSGGISPITGRVTLEGPIKKDTSSFLIGIRSTYSDYILKLLDDPEFNNSSASFSDVIGKASFQTGPKDALYISGYHSRDRFRLNSDTLYSYYNTGAGIQWRHTFSNKLFGLFSSNFTNYNYTLDSQRSPERVFDLSYSINQLNLNADFDLFLNEKHAIKFGSVLTGYQLDPGRIEPGISSNIIPVDLETERGIEAAVYIGDEFTISPKFTLYGGLRLSGFGLVGPQQVYVYPPGLTREEIYITDTINYDKGELIKTYPGLEYRFSMRYLLRPNLSLKFSIDNTRQNIHLLTNTTAIAPTDVWRLSNTYIKPQVGTQYSAGIYQTFYRTGLELSLEGYYKKVQNLLEYKSGADLLVNEVLETDIINAEGRSYGVELQVRKRSGKLTGWLSYTYSRSEVRTPGTFLEEQINSGSYYPSNFDQPHNLSLVSNYKVNRRINFSVNSTYHTGRPTTLPFAQYQFNGQVLPFFTERNQYRIPYYLRFDLAVNLEGNHKVNKVAHGSWTFAVYNLLGRNNAFSVYTQAGDNGAEVYQLSIFSQPIPTITYNFKF